MNVAYCSSGTIEACCRSTTVRRTDSIHVQQCASYITHCKIRSAVDVFNNAIISTPNEHTRKYSFLHLFLRNVTFRKQVFVK
jgi:hypothetical protein